MDLQLFATDEELREFPESKTDSNTVLDKTPSPNDINLMASDLPRSHTDLPKIPSSLPDQNLNANPGEATDTSLDPKTIPVVMQSFK